MLLYGKYKKLRNAAWQCLIDYNIMQLPVDPLEIAKASGIKVIQNCNVDALAGDESGLSILNGEQWYIVYDDECTEARRRFVVAHELGHIFLGHETGARHIIHADAAKSKAEMEADMFAYRLLAPACVLWGLGLHTADEIAQTCQITLTAAKNRADRMKLLYERDKFLTSPIERKLYKQFEGFIATQRKQI